MKLTAWLSGILRGAGSTALKEWGVRELTDVNDLQEIQESAQHGLVFVFKHSTTCPISASAHRRVADYLQEQGAPLATFFLVKVIESRPLSNKIAEVYGVQHQSPQLLLIQGDSAIWDASHGGITGAAIAEALASTA